MDKVGKFFKIFRSLEGGCFVLGELKLGVKKKQVFHFISKLHELKFMLVLFKKKQLSDFI